MPAKAYRWIDIRLNLAATQRAGLVQPLTVKTLLWKYVCVLFCYIPAAFQSTIIGVAVTALEANGYCAEERDVQKDADILNGTHTDFDYGKCHEATKKICPTF